MEGAEYVGGGGALSVATDGDNSTKWKTKERRASRESETIKTRVKNKGILLGCNTLAKSSSKVRSWFERIDCLAAVVRSEFESPRGEAAES